jgi:hypothetical protein
MTMTTIEAALVAFGILHHSERNEDTRELDLFRIGEAGIDGSRTFKRADLETRTDEQDQRERHLHNDQRAARAVARPTRARAPAKASFARRYGWLAWITASQSGSPAKQLKVGVIHEDLGIWTRQCSAPSL